MLQPLSEKTTLRYEPYAREPEGVPQPKRKLMPAISPALMPPHLTLGDRADLHCYEHVLHKHDDSLADPEELNRIMRDSAVEPMRYRATRFLASGTFGRVFVAVDTAHAEQKEVVLKYMNREGEKSYHAYSKREVGILKHLPAHPHVIRVLDVVRPLTYDSIVMVLDKALYSLHDYLKKSWFDRGMELGHPGGSLRTVPYMDYQFTMDMLRQILSALAHLEANLIIHRDLKPDNILMQRGENDTTRFILTDFGMARMVKEPRFRNPDGSIVPPSEALSPRRCTLPYRAPEIVIMSCYSFPVDIWSLGCVVVEMVSHYRPFDNNVTGFELLVDIFQVFGYPTVETWGNAVEMLRLLGHLLPTSAPPKREWWESCSMHNLYPKLVELCGRMLVLCPERRITPGEALQFLEEWKGDMDAEAAIPFRQLELPPLDDMQQP